MNFICGQSRDQMVLIPESLDALIPKEHEIRLIDLFVDALHLKDYQFVMKESLEGRPAYHPKDLPKLFMDI